jgi:hypothetical protein
MTLTCGGCYHYRRGRCKNKSAATYNVPYEKDSQGCQMHLTKWLRLIGLPFDCIIIIIIPIAAIIGLGVGGLASSGGSENSGFEI